MPGTSPSSGLQRASGPKGRCPGHAAPRCWIGRARSQSSARRRRVRGRCRPGTANSAYRRGAKLRHEGRRMGTFCGIGVREGGRNAAWGPTDGAKMRHSNSPKAASQRRSRRSTSSSNLKPWKDLGHEGPPVGGHRAPSFGPKSCPSTAHLPRDCRPGCPESPGWRRAAPVLLARRPLYVRRRCCNEARQDRMRRVRRHCVAHHARTNAPHVAPNVGTVQSSPRRVFHLN
jgi:hypothetical protein